jgi:hypothetical protein
LLPGLFQLEQKLSMSFALAVEEVVVVVATTPLAVLVAVEEDYLCLPIILWLGTKLRRLLQLVLAVQAVTQVSLLLAYLPPTP